MKLKLPVIKEGWYLNGKRYTSFKKAFFVAKNLKKPVILFAVPYDIGKRRVNLYSSVNACLDNIGCRVDILE